MSKHGWERGTLTLPSAAWAPFKKALHAGMSTAIEHDYALALKLHAALVEQKKGKRGFDLKKAFEAEINLRVDNTAAYSRWGIQDSTVEKYAFKVVEHYQVRQSILGKEFVPALYKPQKKDYPKCTSVTLAFSAEGCSVYLTNASREVQWDVEENNHSVERAHETELGKLLFKLLHEVKWTRATGGTINGNDEYHRDNEDAGGGSNYVSHRFGPLGEFKMPHYPRPQRRKAAPKSTATKAAKPAAIAKSLLSK
jgi:hypothetical protein